MEHCDIAPCLLQNNFSRMQRNQNKRQDKWRTQEKLWCPEGGQTHPADGHNLRGEGVLVVVGAGVLVV